MNAVAAAFALLGLAATAMPVAVPDERFSINGNDRRSQLDAYSRAVELPLLANSDRDELRLWVADVMFSQLYGYITDGTTSRECHTSYRWGEYVATVKSGSCVDTSLSMNASDAFALLGDLAKLDQSAIDCGVMDGASVYVEGRMSGQLFSFYSGNPKLCPDEASKLVARALKALHVARQPAT